VRLKNSKLIERGTTIVAKSTGLDRNSARKLLRASGNDVSVALVMQKADVTRLQADRAVKAANGNVREAINAARVQR